MGLNNFNWDIIANGVKPPQIEDPTAIAEGISNIEQMRQQAALAPLRAQDLKNQVDLGTQKLQEANEDRADQDAIHQALLDPANRDDKGKPDFQKIRDAVAPKIQLRNLQAMERDNLNHQQYLASLATSNVAAHRAQLDLHRELNDIAGQTLDAVMRAKTPELKASLWQAGLKKYIAAGGDPDQVPVDVPDDDALPAYAAAVGYSDKLMSNADKAALEEKRKADAAKIARQEKNLADRDDAEELQRKLETAASTHVGVLNQQQHDAWLANLDPDIRARFANLTQFTPQTQKAVQSMALTASQRLANLQKQVSADEVDRRLKIMEDRAATYDRATNARIDNASTKPEVARIANRIINDTTAAGGSLQDAYANAQKYYQDDPEVSQNRGPVVKYLGDLARQNNLTKPKAARPSWMDRLGDAGTPAGGGGRGGAPSNASQQQWREGDKVRNAAGVTLILRGGQWVPVQQ